MASYLTQENLCLGLVPYCNKSEKMTLLLSMNWWRHICYHIHIVRVSGTLIFLQFLSDIHSIRPISSFTISVITPLSLCDSTIEALVV